MSGCTPAPSADLGYALVSLGRLDAGFARLDEALAALTGGEVADPFVVSTTCCALLSACDRAGDVDARPGMVAHRAGVHRATDGRACSARTANSPWAA